MVRYYQWLKGRILPADGPDGAVIHVYSAPSPDEMRALAEVLDEHTLHSALDPDEIARIEFEADHIAVILKRPRNKETGEDQELNFGVTSVGAFIFADRLVVVQPEPLDLFDPQRAVPNLESPNGLFLRMINHTITHFRDHLRAINMIANEIESHIHESLENRYLLAMFRLEKSLVYYVNALSANEALLQRLRNHQAKFGFTADELETLEDLDIENAQCSKQARIYDGIVGGMMDARAGVVNNNLNQLMKTLNIITISVTMPTLVVSIFSMNVRLPVAHEAGWAFWMVLGLSATSLAAFRYWWVHKKW